MYYEYWNLQKPPFDNVPDPGMYVDCHSSMENAIAETLFSIEEGNDCLAVIVGEVGLGKTMSIRMIIDSLDPEKYRIALVTNPGVSFIELLREILGQLTGAQCEEKRKVDLLELFNKVLFETADLGKKVLIFIDEANAITPANLESLRLLTNMQDDCRNLFTMILVGQMELARRLEKRANLTQRIGTYRVIEKISSPEMVKIYVETRLGLAGRTERIFTDDAIAMLWEYSEHGIPRLINKIAKLCLKAGETNGFRQIDAEVVREMGERFKNLSEKAVPQRKPRFRDEKLVAPENMSGSIVAMPAITEPVRENGSQEVRPGEHETASEPEEMRESRIETIEIGGVRVDMEIGPEALTGTNLSDPDQVMKAAGVLAARILKSHPELTASPSMDPISVWSEVRRIIIQRLKPAEEAKSCTALVAAVV